LEIGMLSSASGRWTQDGDSPVCESCGSPFSFFNRRHHCRKCGSLVCGDCSPHKRRALVQTEAESRICTICHNAFAYIDEIARARELPPEFEAEPSEPPPAAPVPNAALEPLAAPPRKAGSQAAPEPLKETNATNDAGPAEAPLREEDTVAHTDMVVTAVGQQPLAPQAAVTHQAAAAAAAPGPPVVDRAPSPPPAAAAGGGSTTAPGAPAAPHAQPARPPPAAAGAPAAPPPTLQGTF
jgi:hypothetical protein